MISIRMRRMISDLLAGRGLVLRKLASEEALLKQFDNAMQLAIDARASETAGASGVAGIVFSMNRPLQLDALLRSYKACVSDRAPLSVLYSATSEPYESAYQELAEMHAGSGVTFIREQDFRTDLISVLDTLDAGAVFFLVDDLIFTRPVDMRYLSSIDLQQFVPSIRLGRNLTRCYTMDAAQALPGLTLHERVGEIDYLSWSWRDGEHDWGYPLSVDGNLFLTAEMRAMASICEYRSPNTFEQALQWCRWRFLSRQGICPQTSMLLNIPYNKVQTENDNYHGTVDETTMLDHWQNGMMIDTDAYQGVVNESAHQEFELKLTRR